MSGFYRDVYFTRTARGTRIEVVAWWDPSRGYDVVVHDVEFKRLTVEEFDFLHFNF